ncbi:contractile injection system tape measure protein [Roseobacter sp.]|uniref:contractile injection system tape measure protein n=1 Tax=Roseobacter sp. TaxID=1907202 RepID=UPI00385C83CB
MDSVPDLNALQNRQGTSDPSREGDENTLEVSVALSGHLDLISDCAKDIEPALAAIIMDTGTTHEVALRRAVALAPHVAARLAISRQVDQDGKSSAQISDPLKKASATHQVLSATAGPLPSQLATRGKSNVEERLLQASRVGVLPDDSIQKWVSLLTAAGHSFDEATGALVHLRGPAGALRPSYRSENLELTDSARAESNLDEIERHGAKDRSTDLQEASKERDYTAAGTDERLGDLPTKQKTGPIPQDQPIALKTNDVQAAVPSNANSDVEPGLSKASRASYEPDLVTEMQDGRPAHGITGSDSDRSGQKGTGQSRHPANVARSDVGSKEKDQNRSPNDGDRDHDKPTESQKYRRVPDQSATVHLNAKRGVESDLSKAGRAPDEADLGAKLQDGRPADGFAGDDPVRSGKNETHQSLGSTNVERSDGRPEETDQNRSSKHGNRGQNKSTETKIQGHASDQSTADTSSDVSNISTGQDVLNVSDQSSTSEPTKQSASSTEDRTEAPSVSNLPEGVADIEGPDTSLNSPGAPKHHAEEQKTPYHRHSEEGPPSEKNLDANPNAPGHADAARSGGVSAAQAVGPTIVSLAEAMDAESGTHWLSLFDLIWHALPTSQEHYHIRSAQGSGRQPSVSGNAAQSDIVDDLQGFAIAVASPEQLQNSAPELGTSALMRKDKDLDVPTADLGGKDDIKQSSSGPFDHDQSASSRMITTNQTESSGHSEASDDPELARRAGAGGQHVAHSEHDPIETEPVDPKNIARETSSERQSIESVKSAEVARDKHYLQSVMALVTASRGPDDRFEPFLEKQLNAIFPEPETRQVALRHVAARLSYPDRTYSPALRNFALKTVEQLLSQSVSPPATNGAQVGDDGPSAVAAHPNQAYLSQRGGLVLFHPFLPLLFERLSLLDNKRQIPKEKLCVARRALQLIGDPEAHEGQPTDPVEKMLLGLPQSWAASSGEKAESPDLALINGLLASVVERWGALGQTSVDGLRDAFICRNATLSPQEMAWMLRVEVGPFDMLLDRLPWSFGTIGLPWMPEPCVVHWRDGDA